MLFNTFIVEENNSIYEKDNYSNMYPDVKVIKTKYINKESFTVTDISQLYETKIQSKLKLTHKLIAKHVIITTITETDPTNPDTNIVTTEVDDTGISVSNINLNNKLFKIDEYIIEDPIIKDNPQGLFKINNPLVYDQYPNILSSHTFDIIENKEPTIIHEQTNETINEPIISHIGNVGPMIRFDKQPRLFETILSLENCASILDTSNIVVGGLNIIYSFETFVEFGRYYDEITIVDLALIKSIGFVDAYPHNPLNSLIFEPNIGVLKGTINFLDTVLYIIELENKSAIAIVLNPKLPLPL